MTARTTTASPALARGLHGLVRVLHEALRAGDRARDIEAAIEAPQVLGRLEGLLERRLRQTQGRPEPFELARVGPQLPYSR